MKGYKIQFKAKKEDFDEDISAIENYLSCLYKNGQFVNYDYEGIFVKDNSVYCNITLPEDGALSEKNDNEYVVKARGKVEKSFEIIGLEELGENWLWDGTACECEVPSFYMLICDEYHTDSSIACGDCGSPIPLYRLPKIFEEKEYFEVRWFERECKAMRDLWMSCLNDRFTFRQRNSLNSQLTRKGRKICKAFEKATGKPFYYYIPFDYCTFFKDEKDEYYQEHPTPTACPSCGADWKAKEGTTTVDYKCDACRLVADKNCGDSDL
jgi:predicted  nucleic acid-binding Zn ribbon protein